MCDFKEKLSHSLFDNMRRYFDRYLQYLRLQRPALRQSKREFLLTEVKTYQLDNEVSLGVTNKLKAIKIILNIMYIYSKHTFLCRGHSFLKLSSRLNYLYRPPLNFFSANNLGSK